MDFKRVSDFIICPVPREEELDMEQVDRIVEHTHNTWQHGRPLPEIYDNTIQGKRAELVIERLLAENSRARYISYDDMRKDGFLKHAPFDGIIYKAGICKEWIEEAVFRINRDVAESNGDTGLIAISTRDFLEDHGIYTIEIKSSLLQDPRDYRAMEHKDLRRRTDGDYAALCQYIRGFYDYFVYPHYCRDSMAITDFYSYTRYVRSHINGFPENKQAFLYELMKDEFDNACNIYTRVFFDLISNEIVIPGYILKGRFFEEPRIRKMPSPKSQNAIYYMYHMKYGKCFLHLAEDDELWSWDRHAAYGNLLGAYSPPCPRCKKKLRIVEVTSSPDRRRHKFLYVCDTCPNPGKWKELNEIHNTNMN